MFKELFVASKLLTENWQREYYTFPEYSKIFSAINPKAVIDNWGNYGGPVYDRDDGKIYFMSKEHHALDAQYNYNYVFNDSRNSNMDYNAYDVPGYVNDAKAEKILSNDGNFQYWIHGAAGAVQYIIGDIKTVEIKVLKTSLNIVITSNENGYIEFKYIIKKHKYAPDWNMNFRGANHRFGGSDVLEDEMSADNLSWRINGKIIPHKATAKTMNQEEFIDHINSIIE